MLQRFPATLALLVLAACAARLSRAATQTAVGGTVGWTLGVAYKPINASTGDTLVGVTLLRVISKLHVVQGLWAA